MCVCGRGMCGAVWTLRAPLKSRENHHLSPPSLTFYHPANPRENLRCASLEAGFVSFSTFYDVARTTDDNSQHLQYTWRHHPRGALSQCFASLASKIVCGSLLQHRSHRQQHGWHPARHKSLSPSLESLRVFEEEILQGFVLSGSSVCCFGSGSTVGGGDPRRKI